jgi:hypothetical protein
MKALKSELAQAILSNPADKAKLRTYMTTMVRDDKRVASRASKTSQFLNVTDCKGQLISIRPKVVAKAA